MRGHRNTPKGRMSNAVNRKIVVRRNRQFGSLKGAREFRAQVPDEVFEFFDNHTITPEGVRRSRGRILEMLVDIARQVPLEIFEIFDQHRDAEISVSISTKKDI